MERPRLELALERLPSTDWKRFEEFASEFLVPDFPTLRTVAASSGDLGRDSELFSPEGKPQIVFQYSLASDWRSKIRATAKRVSATLPETKVLTYVTNCHIGASADSLKQEVFDQFGLVLDIHDASWFLDRFRTTESRKHLAESLAAEIVDPYLRSRGIINEDTPNGLTAAEYRAALVYLQLQWEDDTREKGLTKLSFEALVRAVLQDTNSDQRMTREQVKKAVRNLTRSHHPERVDALTEAALKRLTKRYVRHWTKEDEFCLTHDETTRIRRRLAELELRDIAAQREIERLVERRFSVLSPDQDTIRAIVELTGRIIEAYLWNRGESFAAAVASGQIDRPVPEELLKTINNEVIQSKLPPGVIRRKDTVLLEVVEELLSEPGDAFQKRFRSLADSYTLLAFLHETPDVQSAVSKMFSFGEIWFDTSLLLPVFIEELLPVNNRRFTHMIKAGNEAGLGLRITPGVVEELERHMNRCLAFVHSQANQWQGSVPFLIGAYIETGRSEASFGAWLETFRGTMRPEDDIASYLAEFHSIKVGDLESDFWGAPENLRFSVQEIWQSVHDRRRQDQGQGDDIAINRLARHDTENYVGVLQRRGKNRQSPLGYSAWWLTLDATAYRVDQFLRRDWGIEVKGSPVMSPDFLVNYLAIGPSRQRISRSTETELPLFLGGGLIDYLSPDLIKEAERIREESADLQEHVIRRRVRDYLDESKRRRGRIAEAGMSVFGENIHDAE